LLPIFAIRRNRSQLGAKVIDWRRGSETIDCHDQELSHERKTLAPANGGERKALPLRDLSQAECEAGFAAGALVLRALLARKRGRDAMKILFLHGWHSVPGGVKPTYLKDHGHTVINPALDDDDFAAAVAVAQAEFDKHQPKVVVGSSRGGAVAMNIDSGDAVLVLLCPAWRKHGKAKKTKHRTAILHSRADSVIPYEDSQLLAEQSGLSPESLIEVGYDHRLADDESLAALLWICEHVGKRGMLPWLDEGEAAEHEPNASKKTTAEGNASYVCDACGETIVIPLDISEGHEQQYVEDCPICCNANVIHVSVDADGAAQVSVTPEQDQNLD
jgi:hypothetical protein